jgi:hypothetical protein
VAEFVARKSIGGLWKLSPDQNLSS